MSTNDKDKKKKKGISAFWILLVIIVVMAGTFGGIAYFIVSNNVNNVATKYKKEIQKVPVLANALPPDPDPYDPTGLNYDELLSKYDQLRKLRDDLTNDLAGTKKTLDEYKKYKAEAEKAKTEAALAKKEAESQRTAMEAEKKKLEEEQKKIQDLVAKGDKEGLKDYFEKVDPETAKKVYEEVITRQASSEEIAKFTTLYEGMEPADAAEILSSLGTSKLDLIVEIIKNMNKDSASQILAEMDSKLASRVTEKLAQIYKIQ